MSKTLALLKKLEEQRAGKRGDCPRKEIVTSAMRAKTVSVWVICIIIIIMLVILLIIDQKLFSMIKENTAENFAAGEKLNKIENILADYSRQASASRDVIKKLNDILESLDDRLKDTEEKLTQYKDATEEKITRLKETADTQVPAIQSLIKEKDTLFDKISSLETEVEKFKAENAARAVTNTTSTTALIE